MAKSEYAIALDRIQAGIRPELKDAGFKVRGRTFNRETDDGLTQVINFQMGASDPPGTTYFPGLRENLHGLFTVNLGIYIPEVAATHHGSLAKGWVQEYHCSVRERLGQVLGEKRDIWWTANAEPNVIDEIRSALVTKGVAFLDRFASRDLVLAEIEQSGASCPWCPSPRIVSAVILAERDELGPAKALLAMQVLEGRNPSHPVYVRELARTLGLGEL